MEREEKKKWGERQILASFVITEYYRELFPFDPECFKNSERPDFAAVHEGKRIGIEVTRFQSPRQEPFDRECPPSVLELNPDGSIKDDTCNFQDVTSTLFNKRPTKEYWEDLRSGKLAKTSLVSPVFESVAQLDSDYWEIAIKTLTAKIKGLAAYSDSYDFRVLLIEDRLSMASEFKERMPKIQAWLTTQPQDPKFDAIVVVDGGRGPGALGCRVQ